MFTVGGRAYRRLVTYDDVKKARRENAVPVRAVEESTGRRINVFGAIAVGTPFRSLLGLAAHQSLR